MNDDRASNLLALKARYVFPVAGGPIPDGVVTIQGQRILAVGPAGPTQEIHDLGNVAIVPGLVNAHTHLEFSDLAEPLGAPGMRFTDWIREVLRFRERGSFRPGHAVRIGLDQSLAGGTTTLAEIAQPGWQSDPFEAGTPDATVFLELIGLTIDWVAQTLDRARQHLDSARAARAWRPGLSPHAPYSVHPVLLRQAVSLSASERLPLAMHLAESPEEIELLRSGLGPFREVLEDLKAWDPVAFPTGVRPIEYLRTLSAAHRALVIHGNYLDDEEIAFLARHAERMAVVYCPQTHAYFEHDDYPLRKLLAAGATVALGTDSRASSPDLSLLNEMRLVARRFPAIGRHVVLSLGTACGAAALGRDHEIGRIEPGKYADLAVIGLPDRDADDPHELLFESEQPVLATWCRGRQVTQ